MKNYKLRYLPLFSDDLFEAASYISNQLNNPQAAERLISEVEKAILERLKCRFHLSRSNQRKTEKIHTTAFMLEIIPFFML